MNYRMPIEVSAKLPYQPCIDEIIYVEGEHTIKIDRWRIEYYIDIIQDSLGNAIEYDEGYFSLIVQLMNDEQSLWEGFTEEQQRGIKSAIIDNFSFITYIKSGREIPPSLFVYHSKQNDGSYRFQQFVVGEKGIMETINEVFAYMDFKDSFYADEYEKQAGFPWGRDELIIQMQQCARQLIDMGMKEDEIRENLFSSKQIQNMVISKNGDIKLSGLEYKIKMCPLDKAIYLLFLNHPEGINFSYLPDYQEELMGIYKKLMNYRTTASMRKSVEDVTDPTKNSINEKCARIRRVFIDAVGNYLASSYYITGNRGEVKKIVLDRKYVHWEDN